MEILILYLKSIMTNPEIQILFSQAVLAVTDVLNSLVQSIIVGIACDYIKDWFDRTFKKFFTSHKH